MYYFNMFFTFNMVRWEGSVHDNQMLKFIMRNREYNFSMPPQDLKIHKYKKFVSYKIIIYEFHSSKYYLVDFKFYMQRGFLKLYLNKTYHIPNFERSNQVIRKRKKIQQATLLISRCFRERFWSMKEVVCNSK